METDRGLQVPQELLINLNAVLIVLLVIPVSLGWCARCAPSRPWSSA